MIHCYVTPIKEKKSGKIKQVPVPWARKGSAFTPLFEAFVMTLIKRVMPVNKIGKLLQVYPKQLWTIFNFRIGIAYNED